MTLWDDCEIAQEAEAKLVKPPLLVMSPREEQRFWKRVVVIEDCWEWVGARVFGYGVFKFRGKQVKAHVLLYRCTVGEFRDGLVLDHLCCNPACVKPSHLEPVTVRENTLRGVSPAAVNASKTFCSRGHQLDGGNLLVRPDGSRKCRTCARDYIRGRVAAGNCQWCGLPRGISGTKTKCRACADKEATNARRRRPPATNRRWPLGRFHSAGTAAAIECLSKP